MRYNEYERINDLINDFEKFWIPNKVLELGMNEGGLIKGVVDIKSDCLYLERYDVNTQTHELFKFESGSHPKTWSLDTFNHNVVDLSF